MNTQEGLNVLQLAADRATDWHDAIMQAGVPMEATILMTALLDAQNHMLMGRRVHKHPMDARVLFNRWTATYDAIFLRGHDVGVVPNGQDPNPVVRAG